MLGIQRFRSEPSPGLRVTILLGRNGRTIWLSIRRFDSSTVPSSRRKIQRYFMYDFFPSHMVNRLTAVATGEYENPITSAAGIVIRDGVAEIEDAEGQVFVLSIDEIKAILDYYNKTRNGRGV